MSNVCVTITTNDLTVICGVQGPQGVPGSAGLPFADVLPVTESGPVTAQENSTLFTNTGATAEVDLALPVATDPFIPLSFSLLVTVAHALSFKLPTGVILTNGGDSSSAGGSISSSAVNNFVTIVMVSPTQWIIVTIAGIWDLE